MWVHIVDMFHMTGNVSGRRGASSTYLGSDEITVVFGRPGSLNCSCRVSLDLRPRLQETGAGRLLIQWPSDFLEAKLKSCGHNACQLDTETRPLELPNVTPVLKTRDSSVLGDQGEQQKNTQCRLLTRLPRSDEL